MRLACRSRGVDVYMWEPHQPPAIIEPYAGSGTFTCFLWGIVFYVVLFFYLLDFVSEDSHCLMGGSDVVNLD